jgi:hypothetical protein
MDGSNTYEVDVTINLDYETAYSVPLVYHLSFDGTSATTDGEVIVSQGSLVNTHRIVAFAYTRAMQFVFSDTGNSVPAKIFGWRPEARSYGLR